MRRQIFVLLALGVLLTGTTSGAAGRFDQKLPIDRQVVHILSRLTYGLRSSDAAEVRQMGVEKWVDLQLHPQRIQESPILEAHVKSLETVQLPTWRINEKYGPQPPQTRPLQTLLIPEQVNILRNGSLADRRALIASLAPDLRAQVLIAVPVQALEGLPELLQEVQTMRVPVMRLRAVPANELLTPGQQTTLRTGTRDAKLALINSFDAEARMRILRSLGPRAFIGLPQLRREAMALSQPQQITNQELIENKLYRAIYSKRQLEEVLVDFWMNHFNVFNGKNQTRVLLTSYERDAIRPHVLGSFKDMLLATARHPAMLIYLDNAQSQVPRDDLPVSLGPDGLPARRPGLNENYGRELMELHTLGVDGGYTQDDVIAVARAFTGWTVYDPNRYAEFQFNPAGHDRKEKVLLGHTLPAGRGEQDGLDVIDILVRHPSTATFISKKLAQRFVADQPPEALVERMAATFTKTDGDLRAVLQTMLSSVEFQSEGAWQAKMKSPLEMVVSAVRALDANAEDVTALAEQIAQMGQPLYGKIDPTGYPNTGEIWSTASGILGRINFGIALAGNLAPGVTHDLSRFNFKSPETVARELLGVAPSPETVAAMRKGFEGKEVAPSVLVASVLGSPEFQKR